MTTAQIPVAPGLFTWPSDEPQLIGGQCAECGLMTFPKQSGCPRCTGDRMEEALFDRRGTLWTWTSQEFAPKSPPYAFPVTQETFEPYAVGYVEFPGQAKVEGRITGCSLDEIEIGMQMEVVVVPFYTDDDGNQVMTYAFSPVG